MQELGIMNQQHWQLENQYELYAQTDLSPLAASLPVFSGFGIEPV
jgi:hypothetical protein